MSALHTLAPAIGLAPACAALRINRAGLYRQDARRRRLLSAPRHPTPRPMAPHAASPSAKPCSISYTASALPTAPRAPSMPRSSTRATTSTLCAPCTAFATAGGSRERRHQCVHPAYAKPELLAVQPNEVWSWDITKLKGPVTWSREHLYVILDIFSRYVVGWMIALRETAPLAEQLIAETVAKHPIVPGTLTWHADRGSSMRKQTGGRLADRSGGRQDPQPTVCLR